MNHLRHNDIDGLTVTVNGKNGRTSCMISLSVFLRMVRGENSSLCEVEVEVELSSRKVLVADIGEIRTYILFRTADPKVWK